MSSKPRAPSTPMIYFGVGLIAVSLITIAYWVLSGDEPLGRFAMLPFIGVPVGLASLITGLVARRREQRD